MPQLSEVKTGCCELHNPSLVMWGGFLVEAEVHHCLADMTNCACFQSLPVTKTCLQLDTLHCFCSYIRGKSEVDGSSVHAADLLFFGDPLLSVLQESALGVIGSHDGGAPPPLKVRLYMLLLNPTPLLQTCTDRYLLEGLQHHTKHQATAAVLCDCSSCLQAPVELEEE